LRESLPGLGRLLRRCWPYLRRERPLIIVSFLALYGEIAFRLLEPWPLKLVLDRVLRTAHVHGVARLRFLEALDPATLLAVAAVAVIVFAGLRALAAYYSTIGF
ncbi:MAG: protein tyrosine phosphatase, partial [Gemmatimonadetes bacterium]